MASARNITEFIAWLMSTAIGFIIATSPKNNISSIISEPSKSPSPMLACFLYSDLNSTDRSGIVVPIPMTVRAMKYAGMLKYFAIWIELNTSQVPESISAAKHPKNMNTSFHIVLNLTLFLIFPSVPSICHSFSRYAANAPTSITPSALLSRPSNARTNGSISAVHIMKRCFVKMDGSSLISLPNKHKIPRASPACTMLLPSIVPNPTPDCPVRNPVSELIISGADAAIATTTRPIIASLSPNFFA